MQKTKIPLQKWFLAIALLINAKKSISSHQLARDLELNQASAWYMNMRLRKAMVDDEAFLYGIVEADETFIGGKPRKSDRDSDDPPKRGRGTKKLPVLGAVARGGKVVAQPSKHVTARTLRAFLQRHIVAEDSVLTTDEYRGYNRMGEWIPHMTINHAAAYVEGLIHINTSEGFWSLVKRALTGQHHHCSKGYAAAYLTESCWKYNNRHNPDAFNSFLAGLMAV